LVDTVGMQSLPPSLGYTSEHRELTVELYE